MLNFTNVQPFLASNNAEIYPMRNDGQLVVGEEFTRISKNKILKDMNFT